MIGSSNYTIDEAPIDLSHLAIRNGDVIGFNINTDSSLHYWRTERQSIWKNAGSSNRPTVQIDVNMRRIDNQTVSSSPLTAGIYQSENQIVLQDIVTPLRNGFAICERNRRFRDPLRRFRDPIRAQRNEKKRGSSTDSKATHLPPLTFRTANHPPSEPVAVAGPIERRIAASGAPSDFYRFI